MVALCVRARCRNHAVDFWPFCSLRLPYTLFDKRGLDFKIWATRAYTSIDKALFPVCPLTHLVGLIISKHWAWSQTLGRQFRRYAKTFLVTQCVLVFKVSRL